MLRSLVGSEMCIRDRCVCVCVCVCAHVLYVCVLECSVITNPSFLVLQETLSSPVILCHQALPSYHCHQGHPSDLKQTASNKLCNIRWLLSNIQQLSYKAVNEHTDKNSATHTHTHTQTHTNTHTHGHTHTDTFTHTHTHTRACTHTHIYAHTHA